MCVCLGRLRTTGQRECTNNGVIVQRWLCMTINGKETLTIWAISVQADMWSYLQHTNRVKLRPTFYAYSPRTISNWGWCPCKSELVFIYLWKPNNLWNYSIRDLERYKVIWIVGVSIQPGIMQCNFERRARLNIFKN